MEIDKKVNLFLLSLSLLFSFFNRNDMYIFFRVVYPCISYLIDIYWMIVDRSFDVNQDEEIYIYIYLEGDFIFLNVKNIR